MAEGSFESSWRRRFDRAAEKHHTDHAVSGWSEEGLRRRLNTFEAAWSEAALPPGRRVLDLGCGAGVYSAYLSARGHSVVALDYSMATLGRAAERLRGLPVGLLAGDAYALPFASATFDAVVCIGVFQTLSRPRSCVAELARVLAPGGRVFLMTLNRRRIGRGAADAVGRLRSGHKDLRRYDPDVLAQWLKRGGFGVERVEPVYLMPDRALRLSRALDRHGAYRALRRFGRVPIRLGHAVLIVAWRGPRGAAPRLCLGLSVRNALACGWRLNGGPGREGFRPRVGLVAPFPPPPGGMAVQAERLYELLTGDGLKVERIPVRVPWSRLVKPQAGFRRLRKVVTFLGFMRRLVEAAPRVDLFHVLSSSYTEFFLFTVSALVAGRLWRRPVVVNYRGGSAQEFFRQSPSALRWLRRAGRVTVPSGFLRDVFREFDLETTVVPNLVDLERFRFRLRERLVPNLLVARNLQPIYSVATAIDAFARVRAVRPEATLTIAGDGVERAALERRVRDQGLTGVRFLGCVTNQQMPQVYDACDVALNPTTVDNMPISVLEAFSCGTVVVSSNVGGVPYIVKEGETGYLVEPKDAPAMARRILWLCDHPAEAAATARRALAACVDCTWEHVRPRLLAVYAEVLRKRSPSARG